MSVSSKRPIVFAVLEYGEFPELLRVAEILAPTLSNPPVFFFVKHSYRRLAEDTAELMAKGFCWMDTSGQVQAAPARPSGIKTNRPSSFVISLHPAETKTPKVALGRTAGGRVKVWAFLPLAWIESLAKDVFKSARQSGREFANFLRDRHRLRQRFGELKSVLAVCNPSVLVVGQDGPASDLSLLLIAAGELGIPRLIIPFAMFSLQETAEYANARDDHSVQASALNRLVSKLFPHWVLRYHDKDILRLPGYRALALETTGMIRGLPWTPLSEPVEAITSDSKITAATLVTLGVAKARLQIVGSPVHDRLALHLQNREEVYERLCEEYDLNPGKPLLVCGWPVNMFAWLSGRPIAYSSYESLAAAWARILAGVRDQQRVNVIVSIHPKTLDLEYQAAEKQGLQCRRGSVEELIAACDIFTTLNGSSITAWAIACSKPVVLFDCFLTRYVDFSQVPGCTSVESEDAFSEALQLLCSCRNHRDDMASRTRQVAAQWGQLDGLAGTRMIEVFEEVAGQNCT